METLIEDLIGKKVRMDSSGSNCAKSFHNCIGKVKHIYNKTAMEVFITDGYCLGRNIHFTIGGNNFKYKILSEDWDE